ncbi:hypothetical protein C3V43_11275 [Bacteroides heparinolyticus]|uniref:hypothetical protein n=1 Tax=Bacteroides TaxID=816 RepID=UPI000D033250|nr:MULTISPECIES: hypothetical protein [Bacteroides]AVM58268.1 hypothetical protein C3V43_11275 [Bacteroides heparinolyticus]
MNTKKGDFAIRFYTSIDNQQIATKKTSQIERAICIHHGFAKIVAFRSAYTSDYKQIANRPTGIFAKGGGLLASSGDLRMVCVDVLSSEKQLYSYYQPITHLLNFRK